MASTLNVVVLAAGQGKRMHSALPKVLHSLAGKPLVAHLLDTARTLSPRALLLVVGFGAEAVRETLTATDLAFVVQDPPRGTGDATRVALDALPPDGVTLVTIGDLPLVPADALAALVAVAEEGQLAVLTAVVPDPTGLGRIVRDASGRVRAIVEDRDLAPAQHKLNEVNTGVMAAPTALMRRWVEALKPDNAQNEYYLTDIVAAAVADGIPVVAHAAADER
ncbi:MAG: NTP transferase domain-containing protein, partial [Betaproteobacteria bacterium]